jgi:hypothetical protein
MRAHLKYTAEYSKELLRHYARFYNWIEIAEGKNTITFERKKCLINIVVPTLSVLTTLKHRKRGLSTLERHNLDYDTLKKIFDNPRCHTGKGHY